MKNFFRTVISPLAFGLATAIALPATNAWATPSITSVEGTTSDNSTLTINGTGFTSKPYAKPLIWMDFNSNEQTDPNLSRFQGSLTVNGTLEATLTPDGKGGALKSTLGDKPAGPVGITFSSNELYIYVQRYYDFSIANPANWGSMGLNLKTTRMWSNFGTGGHDILLGYQGKEGVDSARITAELTQNGSVWPGAKAEQVADKWLQEEFVYKASDLNQQDGIFDYIRNGQSAYTQKFITRTSAYPSLYKMLFFDQVSNGLAPNLHVYYDNIYVDDVLNHVVISNSPTYDQASTRVIEVPVSWSDNQIKIHFRSGRLSGKDYYIYVIDKDGNANPNGFHVCPHCPNAPSPITVQ